MCTWGNMITKLTLTIDKQVVEKADAAASATPTIRAEITDRITGMFKQEYVGQDYKELLESALLENNA